MKQALFLLASVVVLSSCSAPKYSYFFSHHQQPVAKKETVAKPQEASAAQRVEVLVASAEGAVLSTESVKTTPDFKASKPELSRSDRADLRHALKKAISKVRVDKKMKASLAASKASGMDHDLKLAIIFGAVGIVGLMLGGSGQFFSIIGGIALIIGVVFFVKWIIRQ